MDRDEDLIPIGEAARRLSVGRQTVARRIQRGDLDAFTSVRDGRATFVRAGDVERLAQPRRIEPQTSAKRGAAIA